MPANEYYDSSGVPGTRATLSSATIRAEFDAIEAAFNKMPVLGGNSNKAVVINAGGTGLTVTTGTLALAGNFSTIGAYAIALTATGATGITLPTAGTLSTLAGAEELTSKTLNASVGKGTWTASGTWTLPALTLGGQVNLNAGLVGNSSADITINTNKFTVAASSGNTVIAGTLTVGGAVVTAPGLVLIQRQTASASSSIDFTTGIDSTYDEYVIGITAFVPATNNTKLRMRFSVDGGSTWESGTTYYTAGRLQFSNISSSADDGYPAESSFNVTDAMPNTSSQGGSSGEIHLFNLGQGTQTKYFYAHSVGRRDSSHHIAAWYGGGFGTTMTAVNGIRLLAQSGNITSGTFSLYGVRKS